MAGFPLRSNPACTNPSKPKCGGVESEGFACNSKPDSDVKPINQAEGQNSSDYGFSIPNLCIPDQEGVSNFTRLESSYINGSLSEGLCRNFSDEELYRFFDVIDSPKLKLCFQLQAFLGLRIGEAVRANLNHINWKQRRILVENMKCDRISHMFLHDLILGLLVEYIQKHEAYIRKKNGYLIFSENRALDRDYVTEDYMNKVFRYYCEDAGLDDHYAEVPTVGSQTGVSRRLHRLTTHSLRHWFITKVWRETKDPVLTQKLARHTNFQVTQNYINLDREDEIRTLQRMFGNGNK